ncbi:amino acid ABC transporter substrate-binding protein [Pseudorhodoferax sp. Leaf267]|uniref:amino acid ABC transporter substrate-binding protein n=1 Tax=Pseudorhodoferax sp. Leaf267 TaxID=1736316 RepID=UPI0006F5C489|nr:amino acid ABC transporter substrate-binding protein [Pseudorhodoferax sp. Leaf267]KQP18335.1 amino acid ABC transporter substrate-binding protein [Pseudorhodoferax sp. Leaf267]
MNTSWKACLAIGLWAALAGGAARAEDEVERPRPPSSAFAPTQLTGTLAKLRNTGTIAIAHRESSVPFSYFNARKEPIGYSIELCKALVNSIADAVQKTLTITWVPVTSESRIDAIADGQADLECGSTTSNLERQKRVAFSPIIFVSGTKLMVKAGSPVRSFRDLAGKKVVVTAGTTNEKSMRDLVARFKLDTQIVAMPDHAASFAQVANGAADAFATDDVLLYGLIAENANQGGKFQVVGEFLSYDPYGIMYRKDDPQLASVITDSFRLLAEDGEIERQYNRWFLRRLPSGTSINLPMSPQLEAIIQTLSVSKPQ